MSKLRDALLSIQRGDTKAGPTAFSDVAMRRLSAIQRDLTLQGWLIFIAVFAGTVLSIWAAALNVHDPKSLAAVSSALGLSVGVALEMLRRIWRELGRTNLLLMLLDNASEAQVAALIDKLIKELPA